MAESLETNRGGRHVLAAVFAIVLPTLVTYVYFNLLADAAPGAQQLAYAIGKTIQFAFPVVWVWLFFRYRFRRWWTGIAARPAPVEGKTKSIPNWLWAIGFGIDVCLVMVLAYWLLSGSDEIAMLTTKAGEKVAGLGIVSVWKFALAGLFYSVVHSFLEEYYWRWFVYDMLKRFVSVPWANLISSLGFMAHHVLLLSVYFGWSSPMTWLCSAGVAIGGAYWAWLYEKTGTLRWSWISHAIVDAGIFALGYFMLRGMFAA